MATIISRVRVHAKPTKLHRKFDEFETADVVAFVQADGREAALNLARKILVGQRWEILEVTLCDQLIEDAVRDQGGEVWKLYQQAMMDGSALKVFPKNFAPGDNGIPAIRAPRVTEAFMDTVVKDVGGQRLETDDQHRMADYRINEWLFELKDLQEEGLLKSERQQRLAGLFSPYARPGQILRIDPEILGDADRRRYFDILSSPIQGQVKSASKQIRSTKRLLNDDSLRGGVIYLNTGYGTFPPEEFGPLVERFVKKDTSQIEAIFCVSTWSVTNGFDTNVSFLAYLGEDEKKVVQELRNAFSTRFEETMTLLVTGRLAPNSESVAPLTPLRFTANGLDFSWLPPTISLPWKEK